jgi:predicted phage gp36 major capsid-like protein
LEKKSQIRKQRKTAEEEQKQSIENGEKPSCDEASAKEEDVPSSAKHSSKYTNGSLQKAWGKESGEARRSASSSPQKAAFGRTTKAQAASHEKQPRASSVKVYSRKAAVEDDKVGI